jgi:short-subunit dehydrogenase
MAGYSATKTTQLSLSRSLANLTKGTQVTVNTVSPGSVKTEGVNRDDVADYCAKYVTKEGAWWKVKLLSHRHPQNSPNLELQANNMRDKQHQFLLLFGYVPPDGSGMASPAISPVG